MVLYTNPSFYYFAVGSDEFRIMGLVRVVLRSEQLETMQELPTRKIS